jgi:hypothetical protein
LSTADWTASRMTWKETNRSPRLTQYRPPPERVADGVPPGQVMAFAHDLKGELLIGIGSGQFYMRAGKFTSAPPEYLARDMKPYLAPSGTQWTIWKNETRFVVRAKF